MVVGNALLSNEMKGKKKGVDIPFVISLQLGLKKNGVIVSFGDDRQASFWLPWSIAQFIFDDCDFGTRSSKMGRSGG